jgi:hypothetical protein
MVEREGIEHDVYAETQLHSDVLNLDDYRGLILGSAEEHLVSSQIADIISLNLNRLP